MKYFKLQEYAVEPEGKIAKRVVYVDRNVTAFVLNIAQGASLPNHTHFECTVLVQVLQGEGEANVDGRKIPLVPGDLLQVEGQENLSIDNTGSETLKLYVTLSPLPPSDKYYVDVDI